MTDRTVHGVTAAGWEVVRYERAGKWFTERRNHRRVQLTLTDAVYLLADYGAHWYEGKPGGRALAAKMRHVRAAQPPPEGEQR
jgi:hypothetical protein